MTLETSLQVKYGKAVYTLKVKSIKMENTWYFFVKDNDPAGELLKGETLELVYTNPFDHSKEAAVAKPKNIPSKVVTLVRNKIMDDKEWWYF